MVFGVRVQAIPNGESRYFFGDGDGRSILSIRSIRMVAQTNVANPREQNTVRRDDVYYTLTT